MFTKLKKAFAAQYNSTESIIRDSSLIFLLTLWFANPDNKSIMVLFIFFLMFLAWVTKKFDLSLVLAIFLSSFFPVGKIYTIKLLDLKQFHNLDMLYPLGIVSQIQISVTDVLFALLTVYAVIALRKKTIDINEIKFADFVLLIFCLYGIFGDFVVSNNLLVSLSSKKTLAEWTVIYFFIRFVIKNHQKLFKSLLNLTISITVFEIFMALQQFMLSSPIGKTIEANFSIESFGNVPDEFYFVFRPIGSFIHANLLAVFLTASIPIIFSFMVKSQRRILQIIFSFMLICLILTLSRTAWMIASLSLLSLFLYFVHDKKMVISNFISLKKVVIFLVLCLPLFVYMIPRLAASFDVFWNGGGLDLRLKQTSEVLGLISQSPFFGTGGGLSVVKALEKYPNGVFVGFPSEVHNYFLLLAVENGIPYLLLFMTFIFFSMKKLLNHHHDLTMAIFIGLSSMILIGLLQPYLILPLLLTWLAFDYARIDTDLYDL